MQFPKVRRPDWIQHCNIDVTIRLAKAGRIPKSIEGMMLVTASKQVLRCVYGSNLKAAAALMSAALWDRISYPYRYINYLVHRRQWEDEEIADEIKEIEEEMKQP